MAMRSCCLLVLASALSLAACSTTVVGQSASDVVGGPSVTGEAPLFPGFAYDTGLMPQTGPAQVSLSASIAGGLHVTAVGQRAGERIEGVKGTGKLGVDLHAKLAGRLKVTSAFKSYDGEIPGLADIDLAAVAEAPFDPFLLGEGESIETVATVPPAKLPDIPLSGVPGHLELSVVEGSTVKATLHGSCLTGADSKLTFAGTTTMTGTLVLEAKLVLDLPKPLDQAVTLPTITIPLPEAKGTIDAVGDASGAAFTAGACAPAPESTPSDPGASTSPGAPASPAGACTTLENDAPLVTTEAVAGAEPVAAGGTVADGTYVLTSSRVYGGKSSSSVAIRRTLRIIKGKFEVVTESEDAEHTAFSGVFITAAKSFTRSFDCPADEAFTDQPGYTTSGSSLTLFFPSSHAAHTYSRRR